MTAVDRNNVLEPASFSMQTNPIKGIPIKKRRFLIPKEEPTSIDNSSFGIPIKKRRFPAPAPQDHINDLEIAADNAVVKNPLLEVKKEIIDDPNLARCTLNSEANVISECESEPVSSTLEPKVSIVQDSIGQYGEVRQHQPSALGFSSSENKICIDQSKNVENTVDCDDCVITANRSNWDLNTTMDAWGGSGASSANLPDDETAKQGSCIKKVVENVNIKSEPTEIIDKSTSILTEPISDDAANEAHTVKLVQGCANIGEVQNSRGNDDDEKVNLSTDMIEEDYGSGCESDGHTTKLARHKKEEEEIEDGEIRESLAQTKPDVQIDYMVGDIIINQDQVEEKEYNIGERTSDKSQADKADTFHEPLTVEVGPPQAETRLGGEELSDSGKETKTETVIGEVRNENAEKDANEDEEWGKEYSDCSSMGKHDIAEEDMDISGGGKRFIDLSPTKTRYSDFEGDRVHHQRNRDEEFTDGPRRFTRDRFQDESFRGSRPKFGRGRGRAHTRFDRSEWVSSDRNFNSNNYNGPPEYRFPRNKYSEDFEPNGYSDFEGSGRGGRKFLRDYFPSYRNSAPRGRGFQMVPRVARNMSPNGNKFGRRFPDDIVDPAFTRYRNLNERIEDHLLPSGRGWCLPPHVRSKSPMRIHRIPDGYTRRSPPPNYRSRSPPLNFRPSSDFQRPVMSNRRRFEMNEDQYYERPVHTKRFNEIDNRRRVEETFKTYRYQYGPKADSELTDNRSNTNFRDREFDKRIKSRPVIAPSRKTRDVEDEGGADWHDDGTKERSRRF